jgi:gliding motility-associated-like protein
MFNQSSYATHIVGGELNYTYQGNHKYRVILKLYIDCAFGSAAAISQDITARIGVFGRDNDSLLQSISFEIKRKPPVRVSKTNYNCIAISPNACVDAYEYDTVVSLPKRKEGYILSFQRCCRNYSILNLINPGTTGANFWTYINDFDSIGNNSSPYFKNLPPNFLCTNAPLVFDHSATDADGDSLVYEFFHPFTGATDFNPRPNINDFERPSFSQILFKPGYSFFNAINSNPAVSIDKKTGILRITPTLQGQFVIGIIVKEFRNGKQIGMTQRDYQFNVQNCVFETTSAFTTPDINCDKEVVFNNSSQNATKFFWDFGDTSTLADTSNVQIGKYTYPRIGNYTVKLVASNGNCADTIIKTITIYDKIYFKLPNDTLLCRGDSLLIKPDTAYNQTSYLWSDGSSGTELNINQAGMYWLKMQRINCEAYDTIFIEYDSSEVKLVSDSLKCDALKLEYSGRIRVIGAYQSINWLSEPEQIPKGYNDSFYEFNKAGLFKIFGINQNNCPYESVISANDKEILTPVKIPNVFTPNGDSFNPYFPEETAAYQYSLQIFNRWGISVFKSNQKPWDGGGLPDGVYYYFIKFKTCEKEDTIHGVVHLIGH